MIDRSCERSNGKESLERVMNKGAKRVKHFLHAAHSKRIKIPSKNKESSKTPFVTVT